MGSRTAAGLQARVVAGQITGHIALENIDRIRTDARQPVQLQLHEHGTTGRLRFRRQPLAHNAERPAAAIVLDADHGLQRLAIDQGVVPPSDQGPVADRPLAGKVDLLDLGKVAELVNLLPIVALGGVQYLARGWLPANP